MMFRTMIVEDNNDFRRVLKDILQIEFPAMKIISAKSAEIALRKIEKRSPDFVFVDIKLPGINGLELARKLRDRFPDIVMAVMTSHDTPEYREAAARCHIDHFLLKGKSTRSEIVSLVRKTLADRHIV